MQNLLDATTFICTIVFAIAISAVVALPIWLLVGLVYAVPYTPVFATLSGLVLIKALFFMEYQK
jgi:hypothetical protein